MGRIKEYLIKNKDEYVPPIVAGFIVLAVYVMANLIIWSNVNTSYAVIYAVVAFLLYFVFNRLRLYMKAKKEDAEK